MSMVRTHLFMYTQSCVMSAVDTVLAGNVLLWNGEVFGGLNVRAPCPHVPCRAPNALTTLYAGFLTVD